MWSYYDLIVAQEQVDRIQSAGYLISPAASREVAQEAITHYLDQRNQREKEKQERKAERRTAVTTFVNAIKTTFRGRTMLAR